MKSSELKTQVREIFEYWQRTMDHPQSKLIATRERAIAARLREGYTVDQVKAAIDGCRRSPFHQGQNDVGAVYDDLTLICRNGAKLEQFIALNKRPKNRTFDPGRHQPDQHRPMSESKPRCQTCNGIGMVDSHPNNPNFVAGRTFTSCPDCASL